MIELFIFAFDFINPVHSQVLRQVGEATSAAAREASEAKVFFKVCDFNRQRVDLLQDKR